MNLFSALALALGAFLLPSLTVGGETGNQAAQVASDDGVRSSLTSLQLSMNSSRAIPLKRAREKAFALELAVRDLSAQIARYKSYYAEDPAEVTSGEAAAVVTKAYQLSLSLERVGGEQRSISHAARIRTYASKMNLSLPPAETEHVVVAHSK